MTGLLALSISRESAKESVKIDLKVYSSFFLLVDCSIWLIDWSRTEEPKMNEKEFHEYLKNYLFTQKGAKFRINFKFTDPLVRKCYLCW